MTATPANMPAHREPDREVIPPPEKRLAPCPEPEKLAYRSRAAAVRDARRFKFPRYAPWETKKNRLYPYQCRCGQWHLTSQEQ